MGNTAVVEQQIATSDAKVDPVQQQVVKLVGEKQVINAEEALDYEVSSSASGMRVRRETES
ncbi:unnamed protein product [Arabis nemorensis]|uniref:Uncharacterized protein n=1 Tax=Arabis nemorensis TaxID=586526 RepID=A0A565BWD5_9BRAS|nr:unnamed protein product [Arabis nemorensis]